MRNIWIICRKELEAISVAGRLHAAGVVRLIFGFFF